MIQRPGSPEIVKGWLEAKARIHAKNGIWKASPKALGLMNGKLQEALLSNEAKDRRLCLRWLWGVETSKAMTGPQVSAVLDWLIEGRNEDTGDYDLNRYAVQELLAISRQAGVDAGQLSMAELLDAIPMGMEERHEALDQEAMRPGEDTGGFEDGTRL